MVTPTTTGTPERWMQLFQIKKKLELNLTPNITYTTEFKDKELKFENNAVVDNFLEKVHKLTFFGKERWFFKRMTLYDFV